MKYELVRHSQVCFRCGRRFTFLATAGSSWRDVPCNPCCMKGKRGLFNLGEKRRLPWQEHMKAD